MTTKAHFQKIKKPKLFNTDKKFRHLNKCIQGKNKIGKNLRGKINEKNL
jgi:hypothetical protein